MIELKDMASDISLAQDKLEFNPERLEWLDNRLNLIYSLQKKFRVETVKELIEMRESFRKQLNRIENLDDVRMRQLADQRRLVHEQVRVQLAALGVLEDFGKGDLDGHFALGKWIVSQVHR